MQGRKKPQLRKEPGERWRVLKLKAAGDRAMALGRMILAQTIVWIKAKETGSLENLKNKFIRSVREEHSTGRLERKGTGSARESTDLGGRERGMAWIIRTLIKSAL